MVTFFRPQCNTIRPQSNTFRPQSNYFRLWSNSFIEGQCKRFNELWCPQSDPHSWYNVRTILRYCDLEKRSRKGQGKKTTCLVHNFIVLANCWNHDCRSKSNGSIYELWCPQRCATCTDGRYIDELWCPQRCATCTDGRYMSYGVHKNVLHAQTVDIWVMVSTKMCYMHRRSIYELWCPQRCATCTDGRYMSYGVHKNVLHAQTVDIWVMVSTKMCYMHRRSIYELWCPQRCATCTDGRYMSYGVHKDVLHAQTVDIWVMVSTKMCYMHRRSIYELWCPQRCATCTDGRYMSYGVHWKMCYMHRRSILPGPLTGVVTGTINWRSIFYNMCLLFLMVREAHIIYYFCIEHNSNIQSPISLSE